MCTVSFKCTLAVPDAQSLTACGSNNAQSKSSCLEPPIPVVCATGICAKHGEGKSRSLTNVLIKSPCQLVYSAPYNSAFVPDKLEINMSAFLI